MSWVTGITLHCKHESSAIASIQLWLDKKRFGPLREISKYSGGSKHPQISLYVAGYNYFPEEEFIDFIKQIMWDNVENVVLIINPEEGGCKVIRPWDD